MITRRKQLLHICTCPVCKRRPYSKIAKDHKAINQVMAGLDEKNRRRFIGLLASQQSNVSVLSQITGLSRTTIYRGQAEVEHPSANQTSGVRQPGGGRIPVEKNSLGF